ncbi:MAG: PhzF family phenazine biosynthesis protein [Pseudomonadales bacterium]|nr:PhzF family phenazine biosynthesis protein [Pseudomonadales bacterium]
MELTLYQIDAFANKPFEGNPAAVIPLDAWLPDKLMQSIAEENNLSETVYFVATSSGFDIRWFTPNAEVDLCGHATLASAYVIFNFLGYEAEIINFQSRSGPLLVAQHNNGFVMNFPTQAPRLTDIPAQLLKAFDVAPVDCLSSEDYILVFENEQQVLDAQPNFSLLAQLDLRGVIITAKGSEYDFVSRVFAPKYGINEDPVTGSAFTQLIPYWAEKLGKDAMQAKQVSTRGGVVGCELLGDRVKISGNAVTYMEGRIII